MNYYLIKFVLDEKIEYLPVSTPKGGVDIKILNAFKFEKILNIQKITKEIAEAFLDLKKELQDSETSNKLYKELEEKYNKLNLEYNKYKELEKERNERINNFKMWLEDDYLK